MKQHKRQIQFIFLCLLILASVYCSLSIAAGVYYCLVEKKTFTATRPAVDRPAPSQASFTNDFAMTFVYIKPGAFIMGSPLDEPGRDNDEKQHRVNLSRGFYMQTTEVTQGQWKAIMGENPSCFKNYGDDFPVENVSWDDVQAFIRKLNRKTGQRYRLPTEAEWEYACRAGSPAPLANGRICETGCELDPGLNAMGWYCGNADGKTHPIAQKQPNAWGLHDMHGNVWEWCQDRGDYHFTYELDKGVITDTYRNGIADPLCRSGAFRVFRGGGWFSSVWDCRSANRNMYAPGIRFNNLGFRLAISSTLTFLN